ncbi:hypothetical protein GCM10023235_76420 [Kitasatospora terrestris]|uniref:Uncharacterized protein n=1 Tax=Kitasatospora terrestris TaxID=258051 RepID=A0ABP9EPJ6_9ACTN
MRAAERAVSAAPAGPAGRSEAVSARAERASVLRRAMATGVPISQKIAWFVGRSPTRCQVVYAAGRLVAPIAGEPAIRGGPPG